MKKIIFIHILIIGFAPLIKANMQDSILIKHDCKIIEHGYFIFCTINDNKTINKTTFSYSLNIKKQTFVVRFIQSDTILIDAKNKLDEFYGSDTWNKKRVGTSFEKYFLLFNPDFLKWNNLEKLHFFINASKENRNLNTSVCRR